MNKKKETALDRINRINKQDAAKKKAAAKAAKFQISKADLDKFFKTGSLDVIQPKVLHRFEEMTKPAVNIYTAPSYPSRKDVAATLVGPGADPQEVLLLTYYVLRTGTEGDKWRQLILQYASQR